MRRLSPNLQLGDEFRQRFSCPVDQKWGELRSATIPTMSFDERPIMYIIRI